MCMDYVRANENERNCCINCMAYKCNKCDGNEKDNGMTKKRLY